MKYIKLYESFNEKQIHQICYQYNIRNYTINNDGSIDVEGCVDFRYSASIIPLKFNKINGFFSCPVHYLKSLEGSPKEVNGFFSCTDNELTSFKGAPRIIRDNFYCQNNKINSFEYFPSYVKGFFSCESNPIFEVWRLFEDTEKIELLNDFDIFRDEDTDTPSIIIDRLNDFLLTIGKDPAIEKVERYKNI